MADRELPAGSVTLLFTDIEGSTRLIEKLGEDGYVKALAEHQRLLRSAFAAHDGVEVDTQGDAFLYAFADPGEALAAAARGQRALVPGPVRVRIGLHTGELRLTGEGYAGRELHRAARIGACGHGGQVVFSAATRALVDVDLVELGEHRLKDFPEPVALFQLGRERFPPLKTISNTNLPRPASSFVGREEERDELVNMLGNGTRLVTLCGPGGSGKTRLAVEAACDLVHTFSAGVFWVGLAALRDPALVTETIGQTLGSKEGLAEHIGERELLLLLDNFEQVVESAPELGRLLERCPNLKLMVTSRELLRIRGEAEYPVPPLAEPEAVELFCERSGLEPDETIAELCGRLDALPLALELAAARTSVLSPGQILERLSQRLDLLKGGRDADPRQQTLRATIEWSHDLLDDEERGLFARLAVFRGGCTLEAAEEVAGATVDTLQALVDKSLLRHTGERFWMLETIREFAAEELTGAGERDAICSRHADYFVALAERAEPSFDTDDEATWLDRLASDEDNFRGALAFLQKTPQQLRLASALWRFWLRRGLHREGRRWLEQALAAHGETARGDRAVALRAAAVFARIEGDFDAAEQLAAASIAAAKDVADRSGEMHGVGTLANIALVRREYARAATLLEQVAALAHEVGDDHALAITVGNRAYLAIQLGDFDAALALAQEALVLGRKMGDRATAVTAALNVGLAAHALGKQREARDALVEGIELARAAGHRSYLVDGLIVAAAVVVADDPASARHLLTAAGRAQTELAIELDPAERDLLAAVEAQLGHRRDADEPATGNVDLTLDAAATRALASLQDLEMPP